VRTRSLTTASTLREGGRERERERESRESGREGGGGEMKTVDDM
jgi:hypothetical protein